MDKTKKKLTRKFKIYSALFLKEKQDFVWNLIATLFKVLSSAILIPFLLVRLPSEEVAVYTVFITISSLIYILDFGFNPSFTRNIAYTFSGVDSLSSEGIIEGPFDNEINYSLLSSLINAMKWFYKRMAISLVVVMLTLGVYYFNFILSKYPYGTAKMWFGFFVFLSTMSLNVYTVWYECLLVGSGHIKKTKQFFVIGQIAYLFFSVALVLYMNSIVGVFIANFTSVLIVRYLSKRFINSEIVPVIGFNDQKGTLQFLKEYIFPNAKKIGLTSLGGALITKASFFIGSIYLSLDQLSSYGITYQVLGIVSIISMVYLNTYTPELSKLRVKKDIIRIKRIVYESITFLSVTYLFSIVAIIFIGNALLEKIGSETLLLSPNFYLVLIGLNFFVEAIILFAGNVLLTKNFVPFYKSSIISGIGVVLLLLSLIHFGIDPLLTLVTAPLIVNLSYQGWKWIWEVFKDLKFD